MPREADQDSFDRDDPDESDIDPGEYDDSVDEVDCPYCGKPVYEKAELCPHCRSYISREQVGPPRKPFWFWAGIILVVIVVLTWVARNI